MKKNNRNTYAVEQRLRFIDFLLAQYGTLNRSALTDYFGISVPQASYDIRTYQNMAPFNVTYSARDKCYVVTVRFQRLYA